jgi:hypothetical protein
MTDDLGFLFLQIKYEKVSDEPEKYEIKNLR